MVNKFLFATHNPSKVKRFQTHLKNSNVVLLSTKELELAKIDPAETGSNEEENALIKAKAYYDLVKNNYEIKGVVSLDTGFYIYNIPKSKQPGKHVQRIAGVKENTTDQEKFELMTNYYRKIARNMGGFAESYFLDVFCLFDGQNIKYAKAKRPAFLTDKIFREDVHFPIASIYTVTKNGKYYHDLNTQEMADYISPSVQALEQLLITI